jgi:hypothetical protein
MSHRKGGLLIQTRKKTIKDSLVECERKRSGRSKSGGERVVRQGERVTDD